MCKLVVKLVFFLALSLPVLAAQMENLYQADVVIADQSDKTRAVSIKAVMTEVLIRVTGDRSIAGNKAAAGIINRSERFLEQFQYMTETLPSMDASALPVEELRLRASFNKQMLDQALRAEGLSVWGRQRPLLLVWLGLEEGGLQRLVGPDDISGAMNILKHQAKRRGIPLEVPSLDAEDTARLTLADIKAGFSDNILAASERYKAEAVLTGNVQQILPELWEIEWSLFVNDRVAQWRSEGPASELVLEEGFANAADTLASLYVNTGVYSQESAVALSVTGIDDVRSYARVQKYLSSLDAVSRVDLRRAEGSTVTFHLLAQGGEPALAKVISLGRILKPSGLGSSGLSYELLP